MDFRRERVSDLAEMVRAGKVSARELTQEALDRIDAVNPVINAFVAVDGEAAMAAAFDLDQRIAAGEDAGPLAGIPLGVKDLEDAAGLPTSHGSAALAPVDASGDSPLVARLRDAGCIIVGKTNTPELGWQADTINPRFGATLNPWDRRRGPGGSSGGSAAAVAAGMVPLATGSDGGGSIRIPSAACGLSGFKPSLGRVPSGGSTPPDWHHLSTKGVIARRIADVAFGLDAVLGPDPTDLRSLPMPEPSWTAAVEDPHVPMKVAWSKTLGYAPVDDEVAEVCERAVRRLSDMGAEVVELESVFQEDPLVPWLSLASTYNLRSLAHLRGTEAWAKVDPGLRMVVEYAEGLSGLDLVKAEDECHRLNLHLVDLFHEVRLLITPMMAGLPPLSGQPGLINGQPDVNWVRFSYPFNMTRSPAGTVCAGFTDDGMPVGLQVVGPQHGDLVVLRAIAAIEDALALDPVAPI